MRVLFAASEMTPIAKVGGLGDVIGALPRALRRLGVAASVVIPRYEMIPRRGLRRVSSLDRETTLLRTTVAGVPVFLVDNKEFLSRGPIYFEKTAFAGSKRELSRFTFFSEAVAALIGRGTLRADIVHCNDWHSGALVSTIANRKAQSAKRIPRTIFTIHNLANQGARGDRNLMREGIEHADMVTTVSPTYAKEIQTRAYGAGLHALLRRRARKGKLAGILNGIDQEFWDPARDPLLPVRLKGDLEAFKFASKAALARELGLRAVDAPLFGLVSRLTEQKGIDLVAESAPWAIENHNAQFVFLGRGEDRYEAMLEALAERFPGGVAVRLKFDEALAHRIYAGSDFFLMPSRFEPSGLGQMISMRYGAIPIVRRTGGLADSVRDGATGICFGPATATALRRAMGHALILAGSPPRLAAMRERARREDWSFDRAARRYAQLYRKLL